MTSEARDGPTSRCYWICDTSEMVAAAGASGSPLDRRGAGVGGGWEYERGREEMNTLRGAGAEEGRWDGWDFWGAEGHGPWSRRGIAVVAGPELRLVPEMELYPSYQTGDSRQELWR